MPRPTTPARPGLAIANESPEPRRPGAGSPRRETGSRSGSPAAAPTSSGPERPGPVPAPPTKQARKSSSQEPPQLSQPFALGRQRDVRHTQATELAGQPISPFALQLGKTLTHPGARGVNGDPRASLRIDEGQMPHRRDRCL